MAFSTTIEIRDTATPFLNEAQALLRPAVIAKIAGRTGQTFVRNHFFKLDRERPNKLDGKRTHFYAQAARGTTFKADNTGATVSVNQIGLRQRIQGGTIKPRSGKYLTIPAKAEAYGTRAREWTLEFAMVEDQGRLRRALVEPGSEVPVFWLIPKAVQKPDPSVMPNTTEMKTGILEALRQAMDIQRRKKVTA